jgi:uncharacterized membrane protein
MFGEISYIGWFHTIVGTAAIIVGLYLLIKDRFIFLDKNSAKFYIAATVITSSSSLFIFSATGSFNLAHVLSVMTIIAALFAVFLHRYNVFGFLNVFIKQLSLTATVFFSMLPTTAEVLQRFPPSNPFADSIEDPLVQSFYFWYVIIFGLFGIYQITRMYREEINGI